MLSLVDSPNACTSMAAKWMDKPFAVLCNDFVMLST